MNKIPSLPSENSKSNREETATCYGVLSSNTEVYQVLWGTEKGDLATCRGHGESPGEVTFEPRYGGKEFFQMEKGREGLLTQGNGMSTVETETSQVCAVRKKLDGRRVVAEVSAGIRP